MDTSKFRRKVVPFGNVYFNLLKVNSVKPFEHTEKMMIVFSSSYHNIYRSWFCVKCGEIIQPAEYENCSRRLGHSIRIHL